MKFSMAISFLSWHDNVGDPPLSGILVQQIQKGMSLYWASRHSQIQN
jgi:hypothetical protein